MIKSDEQGEYIEEIIRMCMHCPHHKMLCDDLWQCMLNRKATREDSCDIPEWCPLRDEDG